MPELPEVESARRRIERSCVGSSVVTLDTREKGGGPRDGEFDDLVYETVGDAAKTERSYRSALSGKTLKHVHRRGKQLWFEFADSSSPFVLFHFGMTGSFAIKNQKGGKYKASDDDSNQWPPRFTKLLIGFSNGEQLAFSDKRRIGRIRICGDPLNTPQIQDLGIDPIIDEIPDCATLKSIVSTMSMPIKALLLDQERLFCGIGNYLVDEILYQARIHPECKANHLTEKGLTVLVTALKCVIKTAVDAKTNSEEFPADWLYHQRWDKVKSKSQHVSMPDGSRVVFEKVAGHTTAIVPSVQRRSGPLVSAIAHTAPKTSTKSASSVDETEISRKKVVKKVTAKKNTLVAPETPNDRNKRNITSIVREPVVSGTRKSARLMK